jgi:hypothetical protein
MELAELVLKYLQILIYPVLIGMAVVLFRKEISSILRGDFKAKYKDLELTIERKQRTIENIKDTQQVAISRMKNSIKELEASPSGKTVAYDLKMLIGAMEESLNYWESEVMRLLRKKKGRYPEETLIDYYFQVESDPWRRSHEEKHLREAITTLLQKNFLVREEGYLVLHSLLIKESESKIKSNKSLEPDA